MKGVEMYYRAQDGKMIDTTETADYRWIITKDYDPSGPPGTCHNAVGIEGPSNYDPSIKPDIPFRMLDDDGVLVYEGLYGGADTVSMFGPLWDFGEPNVGATEIQYKNDQGEWETI